MVLMFLMWMLLMVGLIFVVLLHAALAQFLEFRRLDPTKALAAYESTVVAAPHEPQVLCALAVFKGTHTRSCWSFMLAKNTALTPSPAPHLPHPTSPYLSHPTFLTPHSPPPRQCPGRHPRRRRCGSVVPKCVGFEPIAH
jgi:hypothetical protein